jgi:hypothetical protein
LIVTQLPTGTVTFLFTDIEGSTRLLHQLGDKYADALRGHREVLREAFARHGGVEVDTQGDAFFVAIARASDALEAARGAQAGLSEPVRVRMGLHTGEPLVTDEGYVGIDVHRAARIAAVGHGGQVLVSQSTRDLVGASGLRDLGQHRLKDLTAPERIYQFGEGEFPPLKSLNTTNLPVASNPLVGRETELAELSEMLAMPSAYSVKSRSSPNPNSSVAARKEPWCRSKSSRLPSTAWSDLAPPPFSPPPPVSARGHRRPRVPRPPASVPLAVRAREGTRRTPRRSWRARLP